MNIARPLLLLCWMSLSAGAAQAHAVMVASTPSANATISGETSIEVRFNSRIDAERSILRLFDPAGAPVPLERMEAGLDMLKARPRKLAPGRYRMHWQTLSPDGHISQGDIPFEVSP